MAIVKPMNRFERVTWTKNAKRESRKRAKKVPLAAREGRSGYMVSALGFAVYSSLHDPLESSMTRPTMLEPMMTRPDDVQARVQIVEHSQL